MDILKIFGVLFVIGFISLMFFGFFWLQEPWHLYNFCVERGYDFSDYFERDGKITCISYYQGQRYTEEFKVEKNLFGLKEVNGGIKMIKDKE